MALANTLVATVGALVLTGSPLVTAGTTLLSLVIVTYSVAGNRTIIAAGRKRLNLDAEARKALTFVAEFENSGRGWFWETNAEGTLSYVSQQLADDFECDPQSLLGRQFTDLLLSASLQREADGAEVAKLALDAPGHGGLERSGGHDSQGQQQGELRAAHVLVRRTTPRPDLFCRFSAGVAGAAT